MSVANSLTSEELRVLACLIEKSYTTPDQYPLSTNGLTTACNQKSSRDPVVDYSPQLVDRTLQLLRDGGWVRMIMTSGSRAHKHRHVVDEKLGLTKPQQAVFAVLALRGAQSAGELKTRTERYHHFENVESVERVLGDLSRLEVPLTRNVGRGSGQSQDRWVQLVGQAEERVTPSPTDRGDVSQTPGVSAAPPSPQVPAPAVPAVDQSDLEARVELLEHRLAALERELGLDASD